MTDQIPEKRSLMDPAGARLNRRSFAKLMAYGVGAASLAPLLAACAEDDGEDSADDEDASAAESDDDSGAETDDSAGTDDETPEASDEDEDDSDDAESEMSAEGGDVSVLWRQPVTLNPLFSSSGNEQQVERLIFGALVKMNNALEPVPDLSETIDISDDARVFTFTLHEGIQFNDGEPLTSEDVRFTLTRGIDERAVTRWRVRLQGLEGVEAFDAGEADEVSGIVTPDDRTVELHMVDPNAAFLIDICNFSGLGILPEHVLGDVPPDQLEEHEFSLNPTVTAGAFSFVRYETDQFLELERNDSYFGEPPALDRIFMRILTIEVGQAQLETGEVHLVHVPVAELERVEEIEGASVESVPSPSMDFFAVNVAREHLQDVRLRKAMMHAIDRQSIVEQVYQGQAEVVNSSIFGPEWMGVPEGLNEYPYDPDRARELIEESDWDGSTPIEIMHLTGRSAEMDSVVAIVQEQWRQAGLEVEVLQVDTAELIRRYVDEQDYDVFYNAGGVFRADPHVSAAYFLSDNASNYSNEEVDQLFLEARSTSDLEEREELYTQIAQILNEEVPWIYLWSPRSLYGVSDNLQGFEPPSYIDNKLWNAEEWSLSG